MNLLDLPPDAAVAALRRWIAGRGEPEYRVRQILPGLWQRPVTRWEELTDLPRPLRSALVESFPLRRPRLLTRQVSTDGTVKFLWGVGVDSAVESVLITEGKRRTLCVSSQEGCAYACRFCATGRMGFLRHLDPWEITAQVRELRLAANQAPPTNIVFMGMGEPLHNWAAVETALRILNDRRGFGIGARRITVSTIGIIPALRELAQRPEQFRVALSLHAARSAQRLQLMPIERKYGLADVLDILRQFPRRVTFEYVMIRDVNDADDDAIELARIAGELGALVNLLPLHPGGAPELAPSPPPRIERFAQLLRTHGARATIRKSRGLDISAACGQLRSDARRRGSIGAQHHAHIQ